MKALLISVIIFTVVVHCYFATVSLIFCIELCIYTLCYTHLCVICSKYTFGLNRIHCKEFRKKSVELFLSEFKYQLKQLQKSV